MTYVPGKTHIEAQTWGRGYVAFWACFGHKRPRVIYGKDKKAIVYPTKAAALEAAAEAVKRHEPNLTSTVAILPNEDADEARMAQTITAQFATFKKQKAETLRLERQSVERSFQHKAGKRPVEVITKKAKRA